MPVHHPVFHPRSVLLSLSLILLDDLSKLFFLLSVKALSSFLPRNRWSGLAMSIFLRLILDLESAPALGVLPGGADSEASPSSVVTKPEWEQALDLPDSAPAPDSLRAHVKQELYILFNIGKKIRVMDSYFFCTCYRPVTGGRPRNESGLPS